MSVPDSATFHRYEDVEADVAVVVGMKLFDPADIKVYYGVGLALAVYNVDYTIELNEDTYLNFTWTPTESLLTKIADAITADAGERNTVIVARVLPIRTDVTADGVRSAPALAAEIDRIAMRLQQMQADLLRAVKTIRFDEEEDDYVMPPYAAGELLMFDTVERKLTTFPPIFEVDEALVDTDVNLTANSDAVVPSQKAAKSYVNSQATSIANTAITLLKDGVSATYDTLAKIATAIEAIVAAGWVTTARIADATITYAKLHATALASAADYRAATAGKLLNAAGVWSAADEVTLTYANPLPIDLATFLNAACVLTGNTTLGNPTNAKRQFFTLWFTATGSTRTVSLGTNYRKAAAVETFPINVATSEVVGVVCYMRSSVAVVQAVVRYTP